MTALERTQLAFDLAGETPEVAPYVFARLSPAVPTPAYETYWRFAAERQRIFHRRLRKQQAPWTQDPILQRFKFTNAYRASDRTSQYLIKHVIYGGSQAPRDLFFRTILFKLFNKIETWQLLELELGEISWEEYSFNAVDKVLTEAFEGGESIYSAAYIIPSPRQFGSVRKHRNHLRLLESMMEDGVPERLQSCRRMSEAYEILLSFPSIGSFLAYQFVTDLNYSTLIDFSEREFVVPGPGARDGIRKCFAELGGLNEVDAIKFMCDRQESEFTEFDEDFESLWGRPLQYIDCQNLFCEVDKYSRVAHPDIEGVSGRTRIKQVFRRTGPAEPVWYPPKWGINDAIAREQAAEL